MRRRRALRERCGAARRDGGSKRRPGDLRHCGRSQSSRADTRAVSRGLRPRRRDQPPWHLSRVPRVRGCCRRARAWRPDRGDLVADGRGRLSGAGSVLCEQARRQRPCQGACRRVGFARHRGQCRGSDVHRHAADPPDARGRGVPHGRPAADADGAHRDTVRRRRGRRLPRVRPSCPGHRPCSERRWRLDGVVSETIEDGDPMTHDDSGPGPLAGLRLLELGTLLAGPFAGRLLGDMGAEIIKVEPPGKPDPLREWGQARYEGRTLLWPVQARNKKCITLDLRQPRGQELLLELVRVADVLTENFRPGTLERWNLGYDRLSVANPGIVLARISGYGQTGPYAERAGFASVAEAMGGLRYINGFPGEAPPRTGISLGDSLAAMFAARGILAAVYRRANSPDGRGQVVDVSLMEACFALLESAVPEYDRLGIVREPSGTGLKGIAPSNLFRSRDGTWMVIAANQDNVFRRLCEAMEQPELADDARFATHVPRGENQDELEGLVAEWAARHDAHEIDARLNAAGVVCGPIHTIADIFEDPQFAAREMLTEHEDPEFGTYVGPGIVPKFSETPGAVRWSGPWQEGSHNDEVYCGLLGLSEAELHGLEEQGVV